MVIKVFSNMSFRSCVLEIIFLASLIFSAWSIEAATLSAVESPQNKIANSEPLEGRHQKTISDINFKDKEQSIALDTVASELNLSNESLLQLKEQIKEQAQTIKELKTELKVLRERKPEGMSFEVWAGILLACAALLLTILGIGIAMLSIFGYRKIIKNSSESAQRIADKVARETSASTIQHATTEALIKLLEEGAFDGVIRDAVETISYRGMMPLDELDEDRN